MSKRDAGSATLTRTALLTAAPMAQASTLPQGQETDSQGEPALGAYPPPARQPRQPESQNLPVLQKQQCPPRGRVAACPRKRAQAARVCDGAAPRALTHREALAPVTALAKKHPKRSQPASRCTRRGKGCVTIPVANGDKSVVLS